MNVTQVKEIFKQELPVMIRENLEVQHVIRQVVRGQFTEKVETDNRFDRLLEELRRDREATQKKWEEHREEDRKKWEENQKVINQMLQDIQALFRKYESGIGALGARWGLHAEEAFRGALQGILEQSFGVQVIHITEFDDTGEVFGDPDQVEIDLIIKDGLLIICEIKSSMSRSDVSTFSRKVKFYERIHNCHADRRIIISPMVEQYARRAADKLGIEVYTYAEEVPEL